MRRKVPYTLCAILSAASATRAATTVSVPNTFVAGTPAKAADVNANFTAVVNGINTNAQNIATLQTNVQSLQNAQGAAVMPLIVKDSAGHVVGPYIPFANNVAGGPLFEGVFLRTSAASFVVQFTNQSVAISGGNLWYTTSDCTGTAYIGFGANFQTTVLTFAIVLHTTAYVFQWSAGTSVLVASQQTFNGTSLQCAPVTAFMTFAAPVVASVDLSTLGFVPPFSVQ